MRELLIILMGITATAIAAAAVWLHTESKAPRGDPSVELCEEVVKPQLALPATYERLDSWGKKAPGGTLLTIAFDAQAGRRGTIMRVAHCLVSATTGFYGLPTVLQADIAGRKLSQHRVLIYRILAADIYCRRHQVSFFVRLAHTEAPLPCTDWGR